MKTQAINFTKATQSPDFETIYELYSSSIFKMINDRVSDNDDAEHILISTFVYAFNHYDFFENSKSSLFCWLVKIMNAQIKTIAQNQASQIFMINNVDVINNLEFQV
jgi:DNA-directed RNA polymerase specialized sigma24 family protein